MRARTSETNGGGEDVHAGSTPACECGARRHPTPLSICYGSRTGHTSLEVPSGRFHGRLTWTCGGSRVVAAAAPSVLSLN
jgi:hypothetical protein